MGRGLFGAPPPPEGTVIPDWILEAIHQLYDKLLTQCGMASAILALLVIIQAIQQARTRSGWDKDRQGLLKMIAAQQTSFENLALSRIKLGEMREQVEMGSDD